MTVTMLDSVDANTIPSNAEAVAGYVDGHWQSYNPLVARFPALAAKGRVVPIAVFDTTPGNWRIIDVESGNPTQPSQVPGLIKQQLAKGVYRPGWYCNRSTTPAIDAAVKASGLQRGQYTRWIAEWSYKSHLGSDDDACQWTNNPGAGGAEGPYDTSLCKDDFFPPIAAPSGKWQPDDEAYWTSCWDTQTMSDARRERFRVVMRTRADLIWKLAGGFKTQEEKSFRNRWHRFQVLWQRCTKPAPRAPTPVVQPVAPNVVPGHPELHPEISGVVNTVLAHWPKLVITSTYRAGDDTSYHGKHMACDLGTEPYDQQYSDVAATWIAANLTSKLLEGIHNPVYGGALSVKNYLTVPTSFWGSATWNQHRNHIHLAA